MHRKEIKECKDEWQKAKAALNDMESMMALFQSRQKYLKPSPIVDNAFQQVEKCLEQVNGASAVYLDVKQLQRMLQRSELKNEARSCVSDINNIHQHFQVCVL